MIPYAAHPALFDRYVNVPAPRSIFQPESIARILFYAILVFFPLQVLGIPVGTTKVDISNVIFLVLLIWLMVFLPGAKMSTSFRLVMSLFFLLELGHYFYAPLPVTRFLSSFVWIGGLMLVYGYRRHIQYDLTVAYYCVLGAVIAAALFSGLEAILLGEARPAGIMSEPSPAGMVMLAAVAGIILSFRDVRNVAIRIALIALALALVYISFMLKTTHFVSLALSLVIVAALLRMLNFGTVLLSIPLLIGVFAILSGDAHYLDRFDVQSARITNISLLAWLQGFDQMMTSLQKFPLIGAGMGGTGYFYFFSVSAQQLQLYNLPDLNRFDAFSGFFRLVIELGPVFAGMVIAAIYGHMRRIGHADRMGFVRASPQAMELVFLTTFAFTIVVGTLIKEPTWSRSTVAVAILLLFTVPYSARPGNVTTARRDKVQGAETHR